MFLKSTSSEVHLSEWRKVRTGSKTIEDVLTAFSLVKEQNRCIDYYTPESWPTPFDIIEHQLYDQSGLSILIYHTLINLNFIDPTKVEWYVISNDTEGRSGLVFTESGRWFNFYRSEVVDNSIIDSDGTIFLHHKGVNLSKI